MGGHGRGNWGGNGGWRKGKGKSRGWSEEREGGRGEEGWGRVGVLSWGCEAEA